MSSFPIRIQMDHQDFELLSGGPMEWADSHYAEGMDDAEAMVNYTSAETPGAADLRRPWKWVYVFDAADCASLILAKSWLFGNSHGFDVLWHEPSEVYLLLTDYDTKEHA